MPGLGLILKELLGGDNLIKTVSETVDQFTYSKEEKAEDALKAQQSAADLEIKRDQADAEELGKVLANHLEVNKLEVENTKSARDREIKVTESDNASWLQKNIVPILGIGVVLFTFVFWFFVLFRNYTPKSSESLILGALSTMTSTVLSYYFGSSLSSAKKEERLNK